MKTYIVYVDGEEVGIVKAASHNAAEKKAQKKYPGRQVMVAYTEFAGNPCDYGECLEENPTSGATLALAALAVAGVAWLLFRPKVASAATSPAAYTNELPSFVPSTPPTEPAPAKIAPGPALPQLNCAGKVFVTYKFKDQPLLINVFRRLTIWDSDKTPDSGQSFEDRIWALSTTNSFFSIGTLNAQGGIDPTPFENRHKDAPTLSSKRYLAEAWVETSNGWCLAATDTNYEPWTVSS